MNKNEIEQPLIVAVETSGRRGSAALAAGKKLLAQKDFSASMRHSSELFPAIEELLASFGKKPFQIEHVYLSMGPGSFTGLRIAVTFAKMLALANSAKIITVSTSDVIASNIIAQNDSSQLKPKCDKVATILDAKRGQFFVAAYSIPDSQYSMLETQYKKILDDTLMTAEQFKEQFAGSESPIHLLGEGLVYYKEKFQADGIEFLDEKYWWPQASIVHMLGWNKVKKGEFTEALELQPLYLRRPQLGLSRILKNRQY